MTWREYLANMADLGLSAASVSLLGGLAAQKVAARSPVAGGAMRIDMVVKSFRDPRIFDGSEMANIACQCHEYPVRWNNDFWFEPWPLEGWEASDDAKKLILNICPGITWSNGDTFGAEDVSHNLNRWSDVSVEGHSMAGRMDPLVDAEMKRAVEGRLRGSTIGACA